MVNVNEKAPDFELKDQDQKPKKLSDYNGKAILLAFFPFAFSPVCTDEMGCFWKDMEKFKKKNTEILAISVDSHWALKAFQEKLKVNITFLSDFGKEVVKKYGVLRQEGFSNRAYFVVDKSGVVKFKQIMDSPGKKLDNEELLKSLN